MNIVEAYIKFNGQLIILISGYEGSGKSQLAKFIADLFKLKLSKLSEFYYTEEEYAKSENYEKITDDTKVIQWDDIDKSVNWKAVNSHIEKHASGLVLVGFNFPQSKLEHKIDFHIHVKISKENLFKHRNEYIKKNIDRAIIDYEDNAELIFKKVTKKLYYEYIDKAKIDKFINANNNTMDEMKQLLFNYLKNMIDRWLKKHDNITDGDSDDGVSDRSDESDSSDEGDGDGNVRDNKVYEDERYEDMYDDYHHNKKRKHWDTDPYGFDIEDTETESSSSGSSSSSRSGSSSSSNSDAELLYSTNPSE